MRAGADVTVGRPGVLARQMARHFAHKVAVDDLGGRFVIHLPTGTLELEPGEAVLHLRAAAPGADELARVQQVGGDHLRRFAHAPLAIAWTDGT